MDMHDSWTDDHVRDLKMATSYLRDLAPPTVLEDGAAQWKAGAFVLRIWPLSKLRAVDWEFEDTRSGDVMCGVRPEGVFRLYPSGHQSPMGLFDHPHLMLCVGRMIEAQKAVG